MFQMSCSLQLHQRKPVSVWKTIPPFLQFTSVERTEIMCIEPISDIGIDWQSWSVMYTVRNVELLPLYLKWSHVNGWLFIPNRTCKLWQSKHCTGGQESGCLPHCFRVKSSRTTPTHGEEGQWLWQPGGEEEPIQKTFCVYLCILSFKKKFIHCSL